MKSEQVHMSMNNAKSFARRYPCISIYGAGILGKACAEALEEWDVPVHSFIVSDGEKMGEPFFHDVPVVFLSDWAKAYTPGSMGIMIALSPFYRHEIEQALNSKRITDYFWPEKEVFQSIVRKKNPVHTENFLSGIEPVSRAFGTERGMPLDRFYIERFLMRAAVGLKNVRRVIEVGDDKYSRMCFGARGPETDDMDSMIQFDVLHYEQGMDLTQSESLPAEVYDVFICTQTLNFIYDVKSAVRGAYSLLQHGGTMLATVQGCVGQVSHNDMKRWGDYWRFTDLGIRKLTEEIFREGNVEVFPFGNAAVATAWVQGLALEDIEDKRILEPVDPAYAINIGIVARKEKTSTDGTCNT